jgi:hypothetical protein
MVDGEEQSEFCDCFLRFKACVVVHCVERGFQQHFYGVGLS